ncbi:hypothetical protein BGZ65_002484, partial [Modicella reniformis]
MVTLKLYCLVEGQLTSNAFPVYIDADKDVGDLKDEIKIKKSPEFNDIAAINLLWPLK